MAAAAGVLFVLVTGMGMKLSYQLTQRYKHHQPLSSCRTCRPVVELVILQTRGRVRAV